MSMSDLLVVLQVGYGSQDYQNASRSTHTLFQVLRVRPCLRGLRGRSSAGTSCRERWDDPQETDGEKSSGLSARFLPLRRVFAVTIVPLPASSSQRQSPGVLRRAGGGAFRRTGVLTSPLRRIYL